MKTISRRNFLRDTAAAATALGFAPALLNAQDQPATPRVRKDVSTLASDDPVLTAYRKAIKAMQELPATDPRNWQQQAQIHLTACPHGNFFFLPWHRAYLLHFEEICRELSGFKDFALPYWNWTLERRLPAPFREPGILKDPQRNPNHDQATYRLPDTAVGQSVITNILAESDFRLFGSGEAAEQRAPSSSGPLEGNPHNRVHVWVGGNMQTFLSPLDPVFWLHHANIDRLWALWNDAGNANPAANSNWGKLVFNSGTGMKKFVDASGQAVANPAVSKYVDVRKLGYIYQGQNPPVTPPLAPMNFTSVKNLNAFSSVTKSLKTEALSVGIDDPKRFEKFATEIAKPTIPIAAQAAKQSIRLLIRFPAAKVDPTSTVRVFVNCAYPSPEVPADDPSSVGEISFFEPGHGHEAVGGRAFEFNLNRNISALAQNGKPITPESIQLLSIPADGGPAKEIEVKDLEITVAQAQ